LSQAYDGGLWNDPGLTSSIARSSAGVTALGYGEASALGLSTFDGLTLGGNAVLIKYTLVGDDNLDGTVNFNDFSILQTHYGQAGDWADGDFNYDGTVNFSDFSALQNNYGQTLANLLPGGDAPALVSSSTSPATVSTPSGKTKTSLDTVRDQGKKDTAATLASPATKTPTSTITRAPSPPTKISPHPPKPRAPVAAHEATRQMRTS
jgi:hypothetical protein